MGKNNGESVLMAVIIGGFLILSATDEPDVSDQTPSNKYERCMTLYGQTAHENKCNQYKAGEKE